MRHLLIVLCLLTGAAWSQPPAPGKPANKGIPAHVQWVESWNDAWQASRKSKHPILLMFCTPWSPLCKKMDESVWTLPRLRLLSAQYVMCRLNADEDVLFANR